MKKIFLIILLLLLSGCRKDINEYKEVSDTIVNLLGGQSYNKEDLNEFQNDLINDYLYNLENPEINVSDFIIYNDNYKTTASNTKEIYLMDDKCYIRYNDIVFEEAYDHNSESMAKVICNGYSVILFKDSVKPISLDYNDLKYNYRYLGYYKDSGYNFAYRSYYDGSGLIVSVDEIVKIRFAEVDELKLKNINSVSFKRYILPTIILFVLIIFYIYMKKKKNNI